MGIRSALLADLEPRHVSKLAAKSFDGTEFAESNVAVVAVMRICVSGCSRVEHAQEQIISCIEIVSLLNSKSCLLP